MGIDTHRLLYHLERLVLPVFGIRITIKALCRLFLSSTPGQFDVVKFIVWVENYNSGRE